MHFFQLHFLKNQMVQINILKLSFDEKNYLFYTLVTDDESRYKSYVIVEITIGFPDLEYIL